MFRLSECELEIIRRERSADAREDGLQAAASAFARTFIEPIRLAIRRRRTIAELSRLDGRLLADIGLERGSLEAVAEAMTSRGASQRRKMGLIARLRQRRRRQATIRQLESLDDHVLKDIGVLRGDIAGAVYRAFQAEQAKRETAGGTEDLMREIRAAAAPPVERPMGEELSALHARALAAQALEVASRRQAS